MINEAAGRAGVDTLIAQGCPLDETKLLYITCSKFVLLNHFNNVSTTKLVSASRFGSFVGKFKAI